MFMIFCSITYIPKTQQIKSQSIIIPFFLNPISAQRSPCTLTASNVYQFHLVTINS